MKHVQRASTGETKKDKHQEAEKQVETSSNSQSPENDGSHEVSWDWFKKKKKVMRIYVGNWFWELGALIHCQWDCAYVYTHTRYKRGHFRGKQAPEDRWEGTSCPRCPVPVAVFPQSVTLSTCSAPMPRLWAQSNPAATVCGYQACKLSAQSCLYFCNRCWNRTLPAPELTEGPSR